MRSREECFGRGKRIALSATRTGKLEAWRKFCRSGPAKTRLRLSRLDILHHNHGGFTSNAAARLSEVPDEAVRAYHTLYQPPIYLDGLQQEAPTHPSSPEHPGAIPLSDSSPLPPGP